MWQTINGISESVRITLKWLAKPKCLSRTFRRDARFTACKRSLGQGNVFTGVYPSTTGGGGRGSLYDVISSLADWSRVPVSGPMFLAGESLSRGSLSGRPHWTEAPLPQTETPFDRDLPGQRPPFDRDPPPNTDPLGQRPSLDRDLPGQ